MSGYTLHVKAVEATDIPKVDLTGWADPYLKLKIGDTKAKTAVKQRTGTPVWNEEFHFDLDKLDGQISIAVWDETRLGNREVSEDLFVPLRQFADGRIYDKWFELKHGKSKAGKAHLLLQITPRGAPAWQEEAEVAPRSIPQPEPAEEEPPQEPPAETPEGALPVSIGIETAGGGTLRFFEKNSQSPATHEETVTTTYDNETAVTVRVVGGEHWLASENTLIGELALSGLVEKPRREVKVIVKCSIDGPQQKLTITLHGEGAEEMNEEFDLDLTKIDGSGEYESEKAKAEAQEAATRMDADLKAGEAMKENSSPEFGQAVDEYRQWWEANKEGDDAGVIAVKNQEMNEKLLELNSEWKVTAAEADTMLPLDVKYPVPSTVKITNGVALFHFFSEEKSSLADIQVKTPTGEAVDLKLSTDIVSDVAKDKKVEHFGRVAFQQDGEYEVSVLVGDPNGDEIGGKKKATHGRKYKFEVTGAPGEKKSLSTIVPSTVTGVCKPQDDTLELTERPEGIIKLDAKTLSFGVRYKGEHLVATAIGAVSGKPVRPRKLVNKNDTDGWAIAQVVFDFPEEGAYRLEISTDGKKSISRQWVITGGYQAELTDQEKEAFA